MVLEREVARIGPVVGDLPSVVIAHGIRLRSRLLAAGNRDVAEHETSSLALDRALRESVHPAAVDVAEGVAHRMGSAGIAKPGVVEGRKTWTLIRNW